MTKRIWAVLLALLLVMMQTMPAFAATLGPAWSYEELREIAASAESGDVILITGSLSAEGGEALSIGTNVTIRGADDQASISGLQVIDSSITFSGVSLTDTLAVSGRSHIELKDGASASGADGASGIRFDGSGALLLGADCSVTGGTDGAGVSISHTAGDFYGSIEGSVTGGSGSTGGPGLVVSPLSESGAMMVTGEITGGSGSVIGGHALNLFDLSGNAYVTIAGAVTGGDGPIGGDGIQLVSAADQVSVGVTGSVRGGEGSEYGGDAMILMNAGGSSVVSLSGTLAGGNATGEGAQPGTSLMIVGETTAAHARVEDCILEDGQLLAVTPVPTAEPTPELTPVPAVTPLPAITASAMQIGALPTPQVTAGPGLPPTPEPSSEPTQEPSSEPADKLPIEAEATPGEAEREEPLPEATPEADAPLA